MSWCWYIYRCVSVCMYMSANVSMRDMTGQGEMKQFIPPSASPAVQCFNIRLNEVTLRP